jgi:hypothetical protein
VPTEAVRWVAGDPFLEMRALLTRAPSELWEPALERTGPLVQEREQRRVYWVARRDRLHPFWGAPEMSLTERISGDLMERHYQYTTGGIDILPALKFAENLRFNDPARQARFGRLVEVARYRRCELIAVPELSIPRRAWEAGIPAKLRKPDRWFERLQAWASEEGWGGTDFPWHDGDRCPQGHGPVPQAERRWRDPSGLVFLVRAGQCPECGTIVWT